MSLEILDVSSKFQISKLELLKIKHFDAIINIDKENIIVSMELVIEKRNQLFDRCLEATTINNMNLPSGTQEILFCRYQEFDWKLHRGRRAG